MQRKISVVLILILTVVALVVLSCFYAVKPTHAQWNITVTTKGWNNVEEWQTATTVPEYSTLFLVAFMALSLVAVSLLVAKKYKAERH